MQIILPTREDVLMLHEFVLANSSGRMGILREQNLDGAVGRPLTYSHYEGDGCTIHTVCAVLMDSLARNHAFVDANKRTALMTTIYTYAINEVYLEFGDTMNHDFEELVLWVVQKHPSISEQTLRLEELVGIYGRGSFESFMQKLKSFIGKY